MNCPACVTRELTHLDAGGGVFLDVCDGGCGGIWFDNLELKKLDEQHELPDSPVFTVKPAGPGGAAPGAPAPDDGGAVGRAGSRRDGGETKRACPRCCGIKMRKTFYSAAREVEVDQCGGCNGYWLDHGELEKIRGENAAKAQNGPSAFEEAQLDVARMERAARLYHHMESQHHHRYGKH